MSRERTKIAERYGKLAFVYDAWTWFTERKSLAAGVARAAIRDGEAVLEVAVGSGFVFRKILLANPSGRNVGIDITDAMLRRTRRKAEPTGARFELVNADARKLPFPDATFDLVVNNNMLGLLPPSHVALVLAEMLRVLRPGGRLLLVTMLRPEHAGAEWIYRVGAIGLGAWSDVALERVVRAAGFEIAARQIVEQLRIPSEILQARKPG